MPPELDAALRRWAEARLLDDDTVARIREFEVRHAPSGRLRWPVLVALACGGLLLGAGILLFVAAHWDELSPASRLTLVLSVIGGLHLGGGFAMPRFPGLGITLHALGTLSLGAEIALAGQIFHLQEHWPGGVMLWAAGAALGYFFRRDWTQLTLVALLAPAWLSAEWMEAVSVGRWWNRTNLVLPLFLVFTATTYLTARRSPSDHVERRVLTLLGAFGFLPAVFYLLIAADDFRRDRAGAPPAMVLLAGYLGCALPLGLAVLLRRRAAWTNGAAALATLVLAFVAARGEGLLVYLACAACALGLVAWGVQETSRERINVGMAGFAMSVVVFFFSSLFDRFGRSLGLIALGVLFLAGGWAIERWRRQLIASLPARTA